MKLNYLDETREILNKESYLDSSDFCSFQDVYSMGLDEEIDIFSELPVDLFKDTSKKQIQYVMQLFRSEYSKYVCARKLSTVIPKLKYHIDEDGASIIQLASSWNEGNASLYFAFEDNENDSSFGMVWNDNKKQNFESRSGSIILNNIDDIIREILDFIFRVY